METQTLWQGTQRTPVLSQWKLCWRFLSERINNSLLSLVSDVIVSLTSLPKWKYGGLKFTRGKPHLVALLN